MYLIRVFNEVGCYEELLWQEDFERQKDYWQAYKDDYSAPKTTNQLDIAGLYYTVEYIEGFDDCILDELDIFIPE